MKTSRVSFSLLVVALCTSIMVLAFIMLFLGRFYVNPLDVCTVIYNEINGISNNDIISTVVWHIRLPRIMLGVLVGGGLAIAGAAYQGCFHNPLVSPDILGVSAGSGFGAALGILLTGSVSTITMALALIMGISSVLLTVVISALKKDRTTIALVLSGIVISAVFNALISWLKLVADTESELPAITFWLMGSLANVSYHEVMLAGIPIIAASFFLYKIRWRLNALSLGDEEAKSLGMSPQKTRLWVIAASTLITASAVMVSGIIGWVGLIIPNLCRMLAGSDFCRNIPLSFLSGALFMLLVDFLARSLTTAEIPIGILTAFIGAPFFLITYLKTP